MTKTNKINSIILGVLTLVLNPGVTPSAEQPTVRRKQPVKVFILSGQSNMVGAGKVTGGGGRWGAEFIDPQVSVYEGAYKPQADYDSMQPIKTLKLEKFGGTEPTPYPSGGTCVTRGFIQVKTSGAYQFRPGYGGSTRNIMEVDGKEVHRQEGKGQAVRSEIKLVAGKRVPFKITYLTQDANGLGWIDRMDVPGTLSALVNHQGKYPFLVNKRGQWTARDDVWYKGVIAAAGSHWLGVKSGRIGPELGFGHVVGQHLKEPVLVLKTSQGNRSLSWDFLPPGSKRFEHGGKVYAGYKESPLSWVKGSKPEPINWYAGKQYDDCFNAAKEVLENFDQQFPHWAGQGYEIVGFGWWQGDKDRYNEGHAIRYEANLVHLIKTLREDFKSPQAKFVCATLGQTAKESAEGNEKLILEAQLAVDGETGRYPDFKGNVSTVYTHPISQGGASNSHYGGNAQTYMDVGIAMGEAMVKLIQPVK
ncbi:MAG: sialate O-acetylesterase [Planctomycetota bacterium]|nr:sialate O-acetylesterase [Planctomycetota bacterium]